MVKIPVKTEHDEHHEEHNGEAQEAQMQSSVETSEEMPLDTGEGDAEGFDTADEEVVEPAEEVDKEEAISGEETEVDEVTRLTRELEAKTQEAREHYEARLRLQAEFDNFRKRREKELADFRKYANENLLNDILLIVDDFDRAISAAEQTHKLEDFLQGVELIFTKFVDMLKKRGVKEIEAEGKPFNPEVHEAVTKMEAEGVEEDTVVQVFQKGYYLHDRVLRAAKVGVAKGD